MTVTFDQNGNGVVDGFDQINQVSAKFEAPGAPVPGLTDGTDLAMLTLSGGLPSWATSVQQLFAGNVLGELVTMVGYGGQGLGSLQFPPGGTRWAAQNLVDAVGAAGVNESFSANIISTDFDNGSAFANTLGTLGSSAVALFTEGTTAGGDSGGPLFVDMAGNWLIAGVLSGGSSDSSFGDISWWTGVAQYRSEIESFGGVFQGVAAIPEPQTYLLMLMGLGAIGVARRRAALGNGAETVHASRATAAA